MKKGFTLLETLIYVSIASVVMMVAFPFFLKLQNVLRDKTSVLYLKNYIYRNLNLTSPSILYIQKQDGTDFYSFNYNTPLFNNQNYANLPGYQTIINPQDKLLNQVIPSTFAFKNTIKSIKQFYETSSFISNQKFLYKSILSYSTKKGSDKICIITKIIDYKISSVDPIDARYKCINGEMRFMNKPNEGRYVFDFFFPQSGVSSMVNVVQKESDNRNYY